MLEFKLGSLRQINYKKETGIYEARRDTETRRVSRSFHPLEHFSVQFPRSRSVTCYCVTLCTATVYIASESTSLRFQETAHFRNDLGVAVKQNGNKKKIQKTFEVSLTAFPAPCAVLPHFSSLVCRRLLVHHTFCNYFSFT